MIEGGWICRACWHSNKPTDGRCYRCHTPRAEQAPGETPSVTKRARAGQTAQNRLDTDLPFLTLLATLPMRLYGALSVGVGVLIVILALLSGSVASVPASLVLLVVIGIVAILFGFFLIFLANRVGRHARWAYVVAFLLFAGDAVPRLLGAVKPAFNSDVASLVWLISAWVSFGTGVCAGALLLTSFVGQSTE